MHDRDRLRCRVQEQAGSSWARRRFGTSTSRPFTGSNIENKLLQRYAPTTGEVRRWTLPERISSFALMFGGPDLRTLYVTSAVWDLNDDALRNQPWAGGVLALDAGVAGLPEPRFAG